LCYKNFVGSKNEVFVEAKGKGIEI